jgi:predicted lipoprotein with Yx(FWY)xxD motif
LEEDMMRNLICAVGAVVLVATAGAASGQTMPAGVKMAGGAMADAAGKPLYVWDNDTMKGMSHCNGDCAAMWPPLLAKPGSKPSGDWGVITREDGSLQWTYKDKPLYTFAEDKPGQPAKGAALPHWALAK